MCHCVIEVKYKNDKNPELKRVETKELLARAIADLEKLGTVEHIIVFYNHHTHRLVESWADEMYKEPASISLVPDVAA